MSGYGQVTLAFFVLHGEADTVTEPEVSRALYEKASSADKTIKLYAGMWHGLTSGEPDENIEIVFSDIIAWLDKRTGNEKDVVVEKINAFGSGGVELTPAAMITGQHHQQPPRRTPSRGSYFCGLRGRRLQHHSAM